MLVRRCARALAIAAIGSALGMTNGCGSPGPLPTSPGSTTNRATIVIVGLTATVEPLTTTPQPGLVYRLTYQLHESAGRMGATAIAQHFAFSDGTTADGNFSGALTPPQVAPAATITVQSTVSRFPASTPATHVSFTVTYTDDGGQSGAASAEADISRVGL